MLGRTDSRPRSLLVLVLMAVFGIASIGRLGYWQFVRHDDLVARARDQVTARIEVPPVRGTIYDRSGAVVLATSVERDLLSAFPAQMTGPTDAETAALRERVASGLVAILGLAPVDADALRAKLSDGKAYVVLAHGLTLAQSSAIKAGLADGSLAQLRLEPEPVRVYPLAGGATGTTLAAQLLGFVNRDGTGQYGIEGRWQDLLAGNPQVLLAQRDGSGRPILENAQTLQPGSPGTSVTLTISLLAALKASGLDTSFVRCSNVASASRSNSISFSRRRRSSSFFFTRPLEPSRSARSLALAMARSWRRRRTPATTGTTTAPSPRGIRPASSTRSSRASMSRDRSSSS